MNRWLYAVIAMGVFVAGHAVDAQDIWIGVEGGPSIPRLQGGDNEISRGYSSRLAPNFGLIGEYYLSDQASIVIGLNYSGQGGQRNGMQPITQAPEGLPALPPGQYLYGDFKNESILNYLEIPLMAKYEWLCSEQWRFFVEGGPFIGFLLEAKEKTRGSSMVYADKYGLMPLTPMPVSFDADTDVKEDLNELNWGLTAGIGMAYIMNKRHQIFVEARGEYGFATVQKNTERDGSSNTGCAVFFLGYKYKLTR